MKTTKYSVIAVLLCCTLANGVRAQEAQPAPSTTAAAVVEASAAAAADGYFERARDVIFYALSMIGISYRWGGSTPQTGFDCSGFVMHVYQQIAGLVLPRDSYSMARVGEQVSGDDLRPGDLVFFNTLRKPFSHVGIYLGEQRFVHSPSSGGRVQIVSMNEPYWKTRYNGARRVQK
jgi:cell wall-associated NlpC family hydrolase